MPLRVSTRDGTIAEPQWLPVRGRGSGNGREVRTAVRPGRQNPTLNPRPQIRVVSSFENRVASRVAW